MSKLSLFVGGTVFECEGSEEFIRSERVEFYRAMCDAEEAPKVEESPACVDSCVVTQPSRVAADLSEVLNCVKDGSLVLNRGDTLRIVLTDGENMDFVVTDTDDDGIRLESVECLPGYMARDKVEARFEDFWTRLPAILQDSIIPTERKHLDRKGNLVTESKRLFLPSASEVFDEEDCYGDKGVYAQMEWYKDRRHRIRCLGEDGNPCWWWLLSPRAGSTTYWCYVNSFGNAYYTSTSITYIGAPVCFRISKS